jgi:hypothetical protein
LPIFRETRGAGHRAGSAGEASDYIKVVASLLPRDVNLNVRPLDDLSDEQLLERLRSLTKQAAPLLANLDGDDETEASRH